MKAAVQGAPREAGIDLGDWNWKVVRQFVGERFGLALGRSSCLNYLHRLGFVLKRPKKRLLKAIGRVGAGTLVNVGELPERIRGSGRRRDEAG